MGSLLDKRLLFVTGKGGAGKTTVAAALGLAAARRGKRAIVCEVAHQERISRVLRGDGGAGGEIGFRETELAPDLFAISIDPEDSLAEWVRFQLRSGALAGLLKRSHLFQYLTAAAPGVKELVTIGKIWELAQLERKSAKAAPYDLVVVDAPATGHGLGMLRAPRTFRDVARVGPIGRQAGTIDAFLRDGRATGVVFVALPEEMPVHEALDLERRLGEELGRGLDRIVVNGLYPERFSGGDVERIAALDGKLSGRARAALGAALSEHRRARHQRAHLRRLRREAGTEVATLPYLFEPELRPEDLERLSHELERKL